MKRNKTRYEIELERERLMTHADLKRQALRTGRILRVVRWCPVAKQTVVERVGP